MKNIIFTIISFIIIGFLFACDFESNTNQRTEAFEEERQSREPKRLKEGEIMTAALEWGEEIADSAQVQLIKTLQKAIQENGVDGAVDFCHEEALPITNRVSENFGVEIRRVSHKNRNPSNVAREGKEQEVLDAYLYMTENNEDPQSNVQKMDDQYVLFTRPIKLAAPLCLQCHGSEKDIQEATLLAITEKYPDDKAVGFELGEFRGMWSIKMDKKEVIKSRL
ncbi:MAG: DUF3365 domain-containing protein [Cyclobacteriaceae bacterium]|nr:DUF3365 domain-containing protein [Cyclobacteriaceae bacterium]MCH8516308.1 DUF3365 domain-containing protein [Cyclobacteriaceae bacterium]